MKLTDTQRAAATRLDHDVCLTSGAGCGKTTVLTARFINALSASADVRVDELVAITFTDKAARQMRDKIRRACRVKMRRAETDAQRRLWNQRLRDLDTARISTIHAFCGGLLRRHAVEAGIDPEFAVLEPLDARPLLEAAADDVLRARLADETDAAIRLLLTHYDLAALRRDATQMAAEKRDWLAHYVGRSVDLDPVVLVKQWRNEIRRHRVAFARAELADGLLRDAVDVLRRHAATDEDDKAEQKRRHFAFVADALDAATSDEEVIRQFAELLQMKGGGGGKKANWDADALAEVKEAFKAGTEARNRLGEFFDLTAEVPDVAGELAVALLTLAENVSGEYDKAKAARRAMDFKDLELGALRLLDQHETVRNQAAASCKHLLVDEFQDTSWLQVRLLELMCGEKRSRRTPRLLVVGDAKQSIYRFRDAEVEQFQRFRETFPEDDRQDLDISFRTQPAALDFLNAMCEAFGDQLAGGLNAHRTEEPRQPSVEMLLIRTDIEEKDNLNARRRVAVEAEAVASRLRKLIDDAPACVWNADAKKWRAPRYRDIAIFFRASSYMGVFEDALLSANIPYHVVAGGGFYGQPEIVDLRNLLTALTEPADEVALLGVLRSGMFSITDETLYWLCREPRTRPGQLRTRLRTAGDLDGVTNQQRERVEFAAKTLDHLSGLIDRVSVAKLLTEALRRTGYEAVTAALLDGRRRVGNLRRLVEHARHFDDVGSGGLAEFTERIAELVNTEPREAQAVAQAEAENVVRLMTVHAAKGLEFPIVVLADISRKLGGGRTAPVAWLDQKLGITVKVRGAEDMLAPSLPYWLAKYADRLADERESRRLLYVAATRAEDMLIFSGTIQSGKTPIPADCWLSLLDGLMRLDLVNRTSDCELAYGTNGRKMQVRVLYGKTLLQVRRPKRGERARLFEAGLPQDGKLAKLLAHADADAVANCLDACRSAPAVNRVRFGAKELSLAFAGRRPLVMGNRPVFVGESDAALSPSVRGIVLHRALQEYRWTGPAEADQLVRQAAAALDIVGDETVSQLARDLRGQLSRLAETQLHATIAASPDRRAEAAFLLAMGDARVSGVIDLMYQDADGAWWVLDYKSDRVTADQVEVAVEKYKLQIQLYALAASRYARQAPIGAVFYFLHPGTSYRMELNAGDLEVAEENAVTTIRQLRAFEASRG